MPKTQIIGTIGPASGNFIVLKKMFLSGLDVVRFNFSHGDLKQFETQIKTIRQINKKYSKQVKLLADLKGNRIRVRNIAEPIKLSKNKLINITNKNIKSSSASVSIDYEYPLTKIKKGHKIFLDDGKIELQAIDVKKDRVKAKIIMGEFLKNNKGVNFPDTMLYFPPLNEEDRNDLLFAISNKFDYIAQSFVRNKDDILTIREILKKEKSKANIIAKIENREALNNLKEIIEAADGIMVARGDLAISVPLWEIPVLQKEIILKTKIRDKFVIVATQMLESMTENYRPTRAEITDVANAVFDGADYLMLSEETAIGKYPHQTVKTMNSIIKYSEKFYSRYGKYY